MIETQVRKKNDADIYMKPIRHIDVEDKFEKNELKFMDKNH